MKKSRKKVELICLECNQKIIGGKHLSAHVQKEHDFESYNEYKIKHGLIKTNSDLLKEGAVSCKLCSTVAHDLTSHIIRIHKISCQEYKEKYGDFRSTKFLNDISERVKGENNPAYQHGGKYSPFSDKFIHADKIDKAELCQKVSKSNRENGNNDTTIKYWLNRGYSEQESKDKISERQSTFSLAKCIEKHGEELGRQVWLNRQEKWHKNYKKSNFSKISQKLFWNIADQLNDLSHIHFAELSEDKKLDDSGRNNEYKLRLETRLILPDFIDLSKNKIIEFDGTYWHKNGKQVKNTNALRDSEKDKLLTNSGFFVLRVKEEDYKKNPQEIVDKCLDFLYA